MIPSSLPFNTQKSVDITESAVKTPDAWDIESEMDQEWFEEQEGISLSQVSLIPSPSDTASVFTPSEIAPLVSPMAQYLKVSFSKSLEWVNPALVGAESESTKGAQFSIHFGEHLLPGVRATMEVTPTTIHVVIKSTGISDPEDTRRWIGSLKRALGQQMKQHIHIEYQEEEEGADE